MITDAVKNRNYIGKDLFLNLAKEYGFNWHKYNLTAARKQDMFMDDLILLEGEMKDANEILLSSPYFPLEVAKIISSYLPWSHLGATVAPKPLR
jgi:hypothetical protein